MFDAFLPLMALQVGGPQVEMRLEIVGFQFRRLLETLQRLLPSRLVPPMRRFYLR